MKIREKNRSFVRIIIGKAKTGEKGMSSPIRSIPPIEDATVDEVYRKVRDFLKKECEKDGVKTESRSQAE